MPKAPPAAGGAPPPVGPQEPMPVQAAPGPLFISYASQDGAVAKQMCAAFETAGLPCWIAPRDVRAGESYAASIVQAINSCRMLVLILSRNAAESAHVLREVERASSKKRPVLSVRLDNTQLPPDLEYFLSVNQWLDASGGSVEQILPVLVESVRNHDSGKNGRVGLADDKMSPHSQSRATSPAAPPNALFRRRSHAIALATGIAGLSLAWVLTHKHWLSRPPGEQAGDSGLPSAATAASAGDLIAVLPFADLSARNEQSTFAVGVADEVRDLLSSIPGIAVIGRTSSLDFQGKLASAQAIRRSLGVRFYVEGSVLQTNERVRVAARLIDASNGVQRWSDSYDRSAGDVLKIQDDISGSLVRALQVALGAEDRGQPATIKSAEAYREYLSGRQMYDRTSKEGWEQAAAHMERAIELDPTFAQAFAGLAAVRARQTEWNYLPFREGYEKARALANQALGLDPNNARAHAELANIHTLYDWDWNAADRELKQALKLAPHDGWTLFFSGRLAVALGHWNDARAFAAASVAADPLAPRLLVGNGLTFYRTGRPETATTDIRRAITISPGSQGTQFYLGKAELAQGHLQEALVAFQAEAPDPGLGRDEGLSMAYGLLGRKQEAAQALARLTVADANVWPFGVAQAYAFRGEADQAFKWLDRAYSQHDEVVLITGDPVFKKIENDPRYKLFLKKLKLID